METPIQITFRDIEPSPAIEAHIREKAAKLEKFHNKILGIRVTISAPELQHHKKAIHHVQVDIKVPGSEFVVNKERRELNANEDVYVAIREAFHTAERKLRNHGDRRRGDKAGDVPEPSLEEPETPSEAAS